MLLLLVGLVVAPYAIESKIFTSLEIRYLNNYLHVVYLFCLFMLVNGGIKSLYQEFWMRKAIDPVIYRSLLGNSLYFVRDLKSLLSLGKSDLITFEKENIVTKAGRFVT